jgi:hypothetical protein
MSHRLCLASEFRTFRAKPAKYHDWFSVSVSFIFISCLGYKELFDAAGEKKPGAKSHVNVWDCKSPDLFVRDMAKTRTCRFVTAVIFLLLGIALIFLSIFALPAIRDHYMHKEVRSNVILQQGSEAFKEWKSPTTPVYYIFTVYHVMNADDVISSEAKPNVTEKGPYYYREVKVKSDIWFNENDTVLQYRMNTSYVFERSLTPSHLDPDTDLVTNLNVPFMAVLEQCIKGELNKAEQVILMVEAKNPEVFKTQSVTKLLFGYEDDLTKALNKAGKLPSSQFALFV